jgi:uncharacterized protein DUF1186
MFTSLLNSEMVTYSFYKPSNIISEAMKPEQIVSDLERTDGSFPGSTIQYALENGEAATPLLLKILEKSTADAERLLEEENYFGHIYAMFILAQLREKQAYPLVSKFFSLSEEVTWELAGDIVTEDLGRILASVSCGETAPLEKIIEDNSRDDLVRAAAIDALLILLSIGELERDSLILYFKSLYQDKLERECSMIWNHLVVSSVNIYPEELVPNIKEAYKDNLVDEDFISYYHVDDALMAGKETVMTWLEQNHAYTLVTDAVSDISKWLS